MAFYVSALAYASAVCDESENQLMGIIECVNKQGRCSNLMMHVSTCMISVFEKDEQVN